MNGQFYASSPAVLGMQPKVYRAAGAAKSIHFAIGECWLGSILRGGHSEGNFTVVLFGDNPDELARDLQDRFPRAELIGADAKFERLVARVVGFVNKPASGSKLPLDIRGTAFQQQVWQAVSENSRGHDRELRGNCPRPVGRPQSVRAVGQAIAANPIAVAIPCHRVVRSDGNLSGYRWGVERKSRLQGAGAGVQVISPRPAYEIRPGGH